MISVNIAVEDDLSEAVLRRILSERSREYKILVSYPIRNPRNPDAAKSGYGYIKKNLGAFNAASTVRPHLILVDLDDRSCPPAVIQEWLTVAKHPNLLFSVAVREVEAWLIADWGELSAYLHAPMIPGPNPEDATDPKSDIVNLARTSTLRDVRESLVPRAGSSATVGPYFTRFLSGFVKDVWNPSNAAMHSTSLSRIIDRLEKFTPI